MMVINKVLFIVNIATIIFLANATSTTANNIITNLWPLPFNLPLKHNNNEIYKIRPNGFFIKCHKTCKPCSSLMKRAIKRYSKIILPSLSIHNDDGNDNNDNNSYNMTIKICYQLETDLQFNINENYTLNIKQDNEEIMLLNGHLTAISEWGILKGLETYSQIIEWLPLEDEYVINYNLPLNIYDSPRFKYRSIMFDTGRNFIPLNNIFRTIDAMEMNKLNVFVWHLTDDGAFPIALDSYPDLAKFGALSYPNAIYSKQDVKNVVAYAKDRGIRVEKIRLT
jgi:hexosaminidase